MTSNTIENIPPYLVRIAADTGSIHSSMDKMRNDFCGQLHGLSTDIDAVLAGRFNAFTSMISESLGTIDEVRHTARQTRHAIENLAATSEGLRSLQRKCRRLFISHFEVCSLDSIWKSKPKPRTPVTTNKDIATLRRKGLRGGSSVNIEHREDILEQLELLQCTL